MEKEVDPLSAVVNYWLQGNVTESVVPITWKSIVAALKADSVQETALAEEIRKKYCQQEEKSLQVEESQKVEKGQTFTF